MGKAALIVAMGEKGSPALHEQAGSFARARACGVTGWEIKKGEAGWNG